MQTKLMTKKLMSKIWRRTRKYPIIKDEFGRSKRKQAFKLYDEGLKPPEVIESFDISLNTARRYYYDWKRQPRNLDLRSKSIKASLNDKSDSSRQHISEIADYHGISVEEATAFLQKPWGTKRLIAGKWPNTRKEQACKLEESRIKAAYDIVRLVDEGILDKETFVEVIEKHNSNKDKILAQDHEHHV